MKTEEAQDLAAKEWNAAFDYHALRNGVQVGNIKMLHLDGVNERAMEIYASQERNNAIDDALQACEKMYYEARHSTNITLSQVDAVLLWIRLTKEELEKLKV